MVIFVQHCSGAEDDFVPGTPGWALLPELNRAAADIVIRKTLNDPLRRHRPRGAPERNCAGARLRHGMGNRSLRRCHRPVCRFKSYNVVVVTDGHALNDRPHLDAAGVIRHHHWVWGNVITQRSVRLNARTDELLL